MKRVLGLRRLKSTKRMPSLRMPGGRHYRDPLLRNLVEQLARERMNSKLRPRGIGLPNPLGRMPGLPPGLPGPSSELPDQSQPDLENPEM